MAPVTTRVRPEDQKRQRIVMDTRDGFVGTIGDTPLIRLDRLSKATGCEILGKAEFLNPGGSVKDRAALYIINDAVERGDLRKGGVIVEGTAGNTGIGLALVGNAMGFGSVIVIPDTQSQEKMDTLRLCGAEVRAVPAVPYRELSSERSGTTSAQMREQVRAARDRQAERFAALSPAGSGADGSLTLYIQRDSPGKDKEPNWLPAPNGEIFIVMRLYWPKETRPSVLPPGEGTWQPPGIVKLP